MRFPKKCNFCKKIFETRYKSWFLKKKFCSRACESSHRKTLDPCDHNAWKGGEYNHSSGYICIRINGEYILKHRYLMEQHLKRILNKDEDVHHINGIKTDNRIENLVVLKKSKHSAIHRDYPIKYCLICKKEIINTRKGTIKFCSKSCFGISIRKLVRPRPHTLLPKIK